MLTRLALCLVLKRNEKLEQIFFSLSFAAFAQGLQLREIAYAKTFGEINMVCLEIKQAASIERNISFNSALRHSTSHDQDGEKGEAIKSNSPQTVPQIKKRNSRKSGSYIIYLPSVLTGYGESTWFSIQNHRMSNLLYKVQFKMCAANGHLFQMPSVRTAE